MTKLKRVSIGALIVVAICVPIYLHQWKLKSDRESCQLSMYSIYQVIYSQAGMENIMPGEPIPGGIRALIMRFGPLPSYLVCPSGGTYSFVSETTYSIGGSNQNVRCSHEDDLGHVGPKVNPSDKTKASLK